jgi:hypothetical protein
LADGAISFCAWKRRAKEMRADFSGRGHAGAKAQNDADEGDVREDWRGAVQAIPFAQLS